MRDVDEAFVERCIASGMSSGEGLIAEVADDGQDQPAREKRKLIVESEFAQVMKVLAREGNTLSPVIRNAWHGKTLQTMAKNSPLRATGAHVGIVGQITKQELLRHITATELANGFFNRFMVVAVQRSRRCRSTAASTATNSTASASRSGSPSVSPRSPSRSPRRARAGAVDRRLRRAIPRRGGARRRCNRARRGAHRPARADARCSTAPR